MSSSKLKNANHKMADFSNVSKTPFVLFQSKPEDYYLFVDKFQNPELNDFATKFESLFFSDSNIAVIQKWIIAEILKKTNGKFLIDKQNSTSILEIMKFVYKNANISIEKINNKNYIHFIRKLDNYVVDEIVTKIIPEIMSYELYLNDKFGRGMPMDLPLNTSKTGSKGIPCAQRYL